jgi:hypothetical protein
MIRNRLYTKFLSEISSLAEKLDNALDNLPDCDKETMEEEEIRDALYRAAEKLNDAKYAIEHFSKPAEEGYLKENSYGKFEINFAKGGTSYPLSCGSSLEVYLQENIEAGIEEGWHAGRVEHTSRDGKSGYYFYGPGKPFLYDGMRVRTRD